MYYESILWQIILFKKKKKIWKKNHYGSEKRFNDVYLLQRSKGMIYFFSPHLILHYPPIDEVDARYCRYIIDDVLESFIKRAADNNFCHKTFHYFSEVKNALLFVRRKMNNARADEKPKIILNHARYFILNEGDRSKLVIIFYKRTLLAIIVRSSLSFHISTVGPKIISQFVKIIRLTF